MTLVWFFIVLGIFLSVLAMIALRADHRKASK